MVHPEVETSNRLFEVLADWNDILRSTSLNDTPVLENELTRKVARR